MKHWKHAWILCNVFYGWWIMCGLIWNFNFLVRMSGSCKLWNSSRKKKNLFFIFPRNFKSEKKFILKSAFPRYVRRNNIIRSAWIIDNRFHHGKKHLVRDNYRCTISRQFRSGKYWFWNSVRWHSFRLHDLHKFCHEVKNDLDQLLFESLINLHSRENWRPPTIFLRNFQPSSNFILRFNPFVSAKIDLVSFFFFFFLRMKNPTLMIPPRIKFRY